MPTTEAAQLDNAVASSSHGPAYLNVPSTTTGSSDDCASADLPLVHTALGDSCANLLAAKEGVLGECLAKDKWQPDCSSALCTFPLCTTNFGPVGTHSYFTLRPRRHHCRLCGLVYCSAHTTQKASLYTVEHGKRVTSSQRVCDTCLPRPCETPTTSRSRRSSAWSENSLSTLPSDTLVTPQDDDEFMTSSIVLSHTASISRSSTRANFEASVEPVDELAPIESWMDRSGILSLYPLAVKPSHAAERSPPPPAAGPLFAPSLSARRAAKEKELERTSLRQRRLGADKSFWIPGTWGYQRKDFDPTYFDEDVEGVVPTSGGLVEDGPIRFRPTMKRVASPARTPSEERSKLDLPTF